MRRSFRPPDQRPRHDAARLAELGILEYRSPRLVLYTDIEPEIAQSLPPIIDQAVVAWEEYFGSLPPARDASDFQLTGYIMRDQRRFRDAGLLPVTLPEFAHGKHDAQQFWMNDSEYDYYRRHLMIHEATHCFMQSMGGTSRDVPVWYLEGMAELFATHGIHEDGKVSFRALPQEKAEFLGFGRIPMIQRAAADSRMLSLDDVFRLQPEDFVRANESYAWAWSVCVFADSHPRYRDAFRELGRVYVDEGFEAALTRLFGPTLADLNAEWDLFVRHLCYGFDIERANVVFARDPVFDSVEVAADRGWQATGLTVARNQSYQLTAEGRTVLAQSPRPWESEPQGISIRYAEGFPIGRLIGLVISEADAMTGRRQLSRVIDLGREAAFVAPLDGVLYLRVNDFWNELADNSGVYAVRVRVAGDGD
ncbi:MAG: DUF1570 domain-containing protein [Planctomycetaceae bacterium]|nr:DUF1570 domain-containing protein [Planctomycetaceae bacterium]